MVFKTTQDIIVVVVLKDMRPQRTSSLWRDRRGGHPSGADLPKVKPPSEDQVRGGRSPGSEPRAFSQGEHGRTHPLTWTRSGGRLDERGRIKLTVYVPFTSYPYAYVCVACIRSRLSWAP